MLWAPAYDPALMPPPGGQGGFPSTPTLHLDLNLKEAQSPASCSESSRLPTSRPGVHGKRLPEARRSALRVLSLVLGNEACLLSPWIFPKKSSAYWSYQGPQVTEMRSTAVLACATVLVCHLLRGFNPQTVRS